MKFNKKEYEKLMTYILANCYDKPHVGKTVLSNALYFSDFNYYELYGESITNETYLKSKNGVKPKHFEKITSEMIEKNHLYFRKEPYYHVTLHKYYLVKIPDIQYSKNKLSIINSSIKDLITKNATFLIKYVKNDYPYKITELNSEINYDDVFKRDSKYSIRKKFINFNNHKYYSIKNNREKYGYKS